MRLGAVALILSISPLLINAAERCVYNWRLRPPINVQSGDLVFRHGHGFWTRFFVEKSTREKRFSHVGMIVSSTSNSAVIIHSEASDFTGIGRVQLQDWQGFFRDSSECAIFRYDGPAKDVKSYVENAERKLGVPFDPLFDMDSTNRLYCTEFIRTSINEAVRTNLIGWTKCSAGRIIAIDDIYKSRFRRIYDSK